MKYNNKIPDVLALPLHVAEQKIRSMGHKIGKIIYTYPPKQAIREVYLRVIRQKVNTHNEIEIVVANSLWDSITNERR